jgi:hypothetical protein
MPDILDCDRLVHLIRALALRAQGADRLVVVVAAVNGLLEDGWIGGDAAQPIRVDERLELTRGEHPPADKVQPDALAKSFEAQQRIQL